MVGLLLGLAIGEIGLRILGVSLPPFHTTDSILGMRLRPGAEGRFMTEGNVEVKINREGWRDRDHALEKDAGVFRIAVLGDSYAEALQVRMEETFWSIVERDLNRSAPLKGKTFEALNFGVSGYGTALELLVWRHHAWKYSPDLVLLAVTTGNDVTDNSRALSRKTTVPFFLLQGGELVLDASFLQHGDYLYRDSMARSLVPSLLDHSRLLQAANRFRATRGAPEVPTDGIYREPVTREWKEAWEVTEALLLKMKEEVSGRGARFCVVLLSSAIQVHPDSAVREAFQKKHGLADLSYPNRRLKQMAEANSIEVLDLVPVLAEQAVRTRVPLHGFGRNLGDGHWNEKGHALAGEAIAKWIREQVLVR